MQQPEQVEIDAALSMLRRGAPEAFEGLLPLVYNELRRIALRRGGPERRALAFDDAEQAGLLAVAERAEELLALDEALERLTAMDPRPGLVVECRFFGGLSEEETARALGVSQRTVSRDWSTARGWLLGELCDDVA